MACRWSRVERRRASIIREPLSGVPGAPGVLQVSHLPALSRRAGLRGVMPTASSRLRRASAGSLDMAHSSRWATKISRRIFRGRPCFVGHPRTLSLRLEAACSDTGLMTEVAAAAWDRPQLA